LRVLGCAATGERGQGYFGDVGVVTGTVLDQPFEGEVPVPGPVPPEKVGELQVVLTPPGTTVTGPLALWGSRTHARRVTGGFRLRARTG
jgi:hypothetical protein